MSRFLFLFSGHFRYNNKNIIIIAIEWPEKQNHSPFFSACGLCRQPNHLFLMPVIQRADLSAVCPLGNPVVLNAGKHQSQSSRRQFVPLAIDIHHVQTRRLVERMEIVVMGLGGGPNRDVFHAVRTDLEISRQWVLRQISHEKWTDSFERNTLEITCQKFLHGKLHGFG